MITSILIPVPALHHHQYLYLHDHHQVPKPSLPPLGNARTFLHHHNSATTLDAAITFITIIKANSYFVAAGDRTSLPLLVDAILQKWLHCCCHHWCLYLQHCHWYQKL